MNDEGITSVLAFVLMTQPNQEVRIPQEIIDKGLPENSHVRVYTDYERAEAVVAIVSRDEEAE